MPPRSVRSGALAGFLAAVSLAPLPAQTRPAASSAPPRSAPITNVRYDLTFDSTTAPTRQLHVAMTFDVTGAGPVILSLPAWTPGAYELSWYAQDVSAFGTDAAGKALQWDKVDYDTWRIQPGGAKTVRVSLELLADSLDNAMAWTRPDFALVNGTNVFLYPEGRPLDFPATVTVHTQPDWQVATGMRPAGAPNTFGERNYHDLVDMPFFIGRIDLDSTQVDGKWARLGTYPAGQFTGERRAQLLDEMAKSIPAMSRVFQETPWDRYTALIIFDSAFGGASALEHQSSHVGIYNPVLIGNPVLPSITAHEIFHAWNVKRMRPAQLVPYRYDQAQPTVWLWVSEGITDYYADLALVRPGIIDSTQFLSVTAGKIDNVAAVPPVALEDASLSTWIHPTDGTAYIYYPKGSLAGLLIDILVRDASDNRSSLDDVMRTVYRSTYKAGGRGFTASDWWPAVTRAANGKSFAEFYRRYIDGREPFPYDSVLPLAGIRIATDTIRIPRLGVQTGADSGGVRIVGVLPGGVAAAAGVQPGDYLLRIGELAVQDPTFGAAFRERFANQEGAPLPITVRRNGRELTLQGKVQLIEQRQARLEFDPNASPKAARVRHGLLTGK